jgi:hypothetical protein
VAQLVEWQIRNLKEGGSIPPGFLALPLTKSANSIWLKFTAVVQNAAPSRAPSGVARHGT